MVICWGKETGGSRKDVTLPITYIKLFKPFISIYTWQANAPYSCAITMRSTSMLQVDRWYNNGTSLSAQVSWLTIGY